MKTIKERLQNNIAFDSNGCWIWNGAKKKFGYGYLMIGSRKDGTRKTVTTHRLSFLTFKGEIPIGKWVLHYCDNPSCINPDHLYLGTREDNVKDMMDRGRLNHVIGEKVYHSKLTENQVIQIREERINNKTSYRKLAKKYNVSSHKSILNLCKGKTWKHLLPEPPKDI